jgi:hypothetical protein
MPSLIWPQQESSLAKRASVVGPDFLNPLFPRLAYEQVNSSLGQAKHGPLHDRKEWRSGLAYPLDTARAPSHLDEGAHGY